MYSATYLVKLVGMSPLLMHKDDITSSELIKKWHKNPANKQFSQAGDDRSPAWTWAGYLYQANGVIVIDADNLMSMLKEGGKKCPSSGKSTFKAATQSGIMVNEIGWPIDCGKGPISTDQINRLIESGNMDFAAHENLARELGFSLFTKRAKIGKAKHVRVRPRFETGWTASGTVTVLDQTITQEVLTNILTMAGRFCGLCDWRPSSPSSGPFGCFIPEIDCA